MSNPVASPVLINRILVENNGPAEVTMLLSLREAVTKDAFPSTRSIDVSVKAKETKTIDIESAYVRQMSVEYQYPENVSEADREMALGTISLTLVYRDPENQKADEIIFETSPLPGTQGWDLTFIQRPAAAMDAWPLAESESELMEPFQSTKSRCQKRQSKWKDSLFWLVVIVFVFLFFRWMGKL